MQHNAQSIRPFIGAKDYQLSRSFYRDWGFQEVVLEPKLSYFEKEGIGFYLQDYYAKEWVDNSMVFMQVADVERFWNEVVALDLPSRYPGSKLVPIRTERWGKVCFVHDPSNILWHVGEFI